MALYTAFKIFDPRVESGKSYLHKPLLNLKFWEYLVSYFPCTIDFEETLDSGSQYVFGYHPHGILSYGAQLIGGCGKLKMREKCNDIDIRPVALPIALRVPIFGDYLLALGTISCSRTSIRNALKERASVAIVVGGAQESLHGEPGKPELILDKRKGFVREAIMAG
ncbi:diacylglycerol O-acyltransferase 1 [Mycoemilia scoparia]|uniref:diacylglycerol O-acyltransferase n=1 Tax=Mycoemilia scoparia TaxID=417184 RepID=A0A9W8DRY4_9FUNG|nr:diacylglycerol O-acyltransferase 1 [Mycoemilia scoparia]